MPLVNLEAEPTPSMRRWFGLSLGGLLLIFAWLVYHYRAAGNVALSYVLAGFGFAVVVVYYAFPRSQIVIIRGWQLLTFPLAWIVGHGLLGITYFLVVCPIGFVLRMTGSDPLRLRKRPEEDSMWEARESDKNSKRYFKQF